MNLVNCLFWKAKSFKYLSKRYSLSLNSSSVGKEEHLIITWKTQVQNRGEVERNLPSSQVWQKCSEIINQRQVRAIPMLSADAGERRPRWHWHWSRQIALALLGWSWDNVPQAPGIHRELRHQERRNQDGKAKKLRKGESDFKEKS